VTLALVLALAWGAIAAAPVARAARRRTVATRGRELCAPSNRSRGGRRHRQSRLSAAAHRALAVLRAPWRVRERRRRDDLLARELTIAVDLVGVGVAAGLTPFLAVREAAEWSPPLIADALRRVPRACALGQSFDDAVRELGVSVPGIRMLTDALRTSSRLGTPVAPALARLATEVRTDLRRRAETRARTVPVRLCFPLVGCILPAFALLTVVPVVLDGMHV
jgi:Flp pilus assembly protein TadB